MGIRGQKGRLGLDSLVLNSEQWRAGAGFTAVGGSVRMIIWGILVLSVI